MFAALITFGHFSAWMVRKWAKDYVRYPKVSFSNVSLTSGERRQTLATALSLLMMNSGVPSGATTPCHISGSNPIWGKPASAMVGAFGGALWKSGFGLSLFSHLIGGPKTQRGAILPNGAPDYRGNFKSGSASKQNRS